VRKRATLLFAIFMAASVHAEEATTVMRAPVMMDVGNGLHLQIEYIEAKDYRLLPKGSHVSTQTQFFAETSASFKNFSPPALRVEIEARLLAQKMIRVMGCSDPGAANCNNADDVVPNTWGILTMDSAGCRGDTLLTGTSASRRATDKGLGSDGAGTVEPVTDFRMAGRLNGSDALFFATFESVDPVSASEQLNVITLFSKTCGLN
jgi:hypothetical protein